MDFLTKIQLPFSLHCSNNGLLILGTAAILAVITTMILICFLLKVMKENEQLYLTNQKLAEEIDKIKNDKQISSTRKQ